MGGAVGNREAGGVPRVGRFCVRRRGRLPDRRRGHGHFGRGRLSLVEESRGSRPVAALISAAGNCKGVVMITHSTTGEDRLASSANMANAKLRLIAQTTTAQPDRLPRCLL